MRGNKLLKKAVNITVTAAWRLSASPHIRVSVGYGHMGQHHRGKKVGLHMAGGRVQNVSASLRSPGSRPLAGTAKEGVVSGKRVLRYFRQTNPPADRLNMLPRYKPTEKASGSIKRMSATDMPNRL